VPDAADLTRRRRLGAWYTPPELVDVVVDEALRDLWRTGAALRVLDPACGDGRFLAAVAARLGDRCELTGVDIDAEALGAARKGLGRDATLLHANALQRVWSEEPFDLVVGNPPFLSQLSQLTSRGGASPHGGGVYADAAVEFLALAHRLVRPDGGRVALVLPMSVLASRDADPVRRSIGADSAVRSCWWSERSVFPEANVRTCALVVERGVTQGEVRRSQGLPPTLAPIVLPRATSGASAGSWAWLVADQLGAPPLDESALQTDGTLGDRALIRADFRQQYYGLVGAVADDGGGPPLITSGLIDRGRCWWGERPTRFAGQRYAAPTVHLDRLDDRMRAWAAQRLVPKVLVASQTRIIEAVADPDGRWLPSVPVVSVIPHDPADVWACAAVLTSPVASSWLAVRSAGTGLSARSLRVSAPVLADLPWPRGDLGPAPEALRAGHVDECGASVDAAYGMRPGRGSMT
jgi:SAM-dependent methyltransferase